MSLTKKQKEVINLMQEGWELGRMDVCLNASTPLPKRYRLQKMGWGKVEKQKKFQKERFTH